MSNATTTRATYTIETDCGGYTITETKTGWIVDIWSRVTGSTTGRKLLAPYGTAGYKRGENLSAEHNDALTIGQAIAFAASEGAARVLRSGDVVR